MQYENYPLLFQVRCGTQAPEAHNFLVPNGPRTHEYMDAFNKECEEWLKGITKDEKYPDNIRRTTMKYQRGDYTGRGIVYRPDTEDILPICIFTHGGSYLFWTPEYYDLMCANIAAEGNCVVVNLDFRMNIDVLVPDMMEDAYEGILETVRQASSFNADPARIALMGDSSGATMAMGLSIMCRDRVEAPKISHRILMAGGIGFDLRDLDNGNVHASETKLMGAINVIKRAFKDMAQSQHPYYCPMNDKHMEQCPSTTFVVGTADYMWREVSIYAKKLTDAGVDVNVGLFQGMPHGFYNGGCGPASRDCWVFVGEALKKYLG